MNGVSFGLKEGETLGVVGESGCGKSVTMLSILGLIATPPGKVEAGKANFFGQDLLKMSKDEIRAVRGAQIGMVFQDPMTSLNPVLTMGRQLQEPLMLHLGMTKKQAEERAAELLEMVGIPNAADRLKDYPHQYLRGNAPARDDRHGTFVLAPGADCGRTNHCAGCDDPGPDHGSGQTPAQ